MTTDDLLERIDQPERLPAKLLRAEGLQQQLGLVEGILHLNHCGLVEGNVLCDGVLGRAH